MKPDSSIDPVLQPLEDNPFQALISDQFQISDILEWVLNQFGPSDILQSSFSIAEEYIRKIISLKEENLISSIVLLLDYKATNKTIDLWHFMGAVFDSTFLSQNHSKMILIKSYSGRKATIITSQNMARGNRNECYFISESAAIYDRLRVQFEDVTGNNSIVLNELLSGNS